MIPFERSRPEGCPSDLRLDRLLAGELAPAEEQATRAHLDGCGRCAARFAALDAGRAAFLADPPPLRLPAPPRAPAPAVRRPRAWALVPTVTAALGAAAVLALVLRTRPPAGPTGDAGPTGGDRGARVVQAEQGTRTKGGDGRIGFYVARGEGAVPGGPGEVVHPGDRLQFTYSAAEAGYFALLSVDGAHKASIYFPAGAAAAPIQAGEEVPLPSSVVLDEALGAETLYGLFCRAPVDLEPLRAALESAPDRPPAPAGCRVDRVLIDKRAAP